MADQVKAIIKRAASVLIVLAAGFALGYGFGKSASTEADFMRGYCAGLDIADTSCNQWRKAT